MELTLREAATLLGRSPRTLRDQLVRGAIQGIKRAGQWFVQRSDLPLTERQRAELERRVEAVRSTTEEVLRPYEDRAAKSRKSVRDLEVFRLAEELRQRWNVLAAREPEVVLPARALRGLERGMVDLCEATHHFDRERKLQALRGTRVQWSRAVGWLLLSGANATEAQEIAQWIEARLLPSLSGLLRWAEKLGRAKPERDA